MIKERYIKYPYDFFLSVVLQMDPPDPESVEDRFQHTVASLPLAQAVVVPSSWFVKRTDIPEVKLSSIVSKRKAVTLSEKGLIGLFTGLWPSPRSAEV